MSLLDEILEGVDRTEQANGSGQGMMGGLLDEIADAAMGKTQPEQRPTEIRPPYQEGRSAPVIMDMPREMRPGFGTGSGLGTVSTQEARRNVFAHDRGLPVDKYRTFKGGGIGFHHDDGNFYMEPGTSEAQVENDKPFLHRLGNILTHRDEPEDWPTGQAIGETITGVGPQVAFGMAGAAVGGPPGLLLGVGTGEAARQTTGAYSYGEEMPFMDRANKIAEEMMWAAGGEGALRFLKPVGRALLGGSNATGGRLGAIMRHPDRVNVDEMARVRGTAKELGMADPGVAAAGNPEINRLVGGATGHEASTDIMGEWIEGQADSALRGVQRELAESVYPKPVTMNEAGHMIADKADDGVRALRSQRANDPVVRAGYDGIKGRVDYQVAEPAVAKIDELMAASDVGMPTHSALKRVRDMLTTEVPTPGGEAVRIPQYRMQVLDEAKQEIAHAWKHTPEHAPRPGVQVKVNEVLDELRTAMGESFPPYKAATRQYAQLSDDLGINAHEAGPIGDIRRMKREKQIADIPRTLDSYTPQTLAPARELLAEGGDESVMAGVRANLENRLLKAGAELSDDVGATGAKRDAFVSFDRWFSAPSTNKQMEVLLGEGSEQFERYQMLTEVFKKLRPVMQRGPSRTSKETMSNAAGARGPISLFFRALRPLVTPQKLIGDMALGMRMSTRMERLATLITDGTGADALESMYRFKPGTTEFIDAASRFAAIVFGNVDEIGGGEDDGDWDLPQED